MCQTSRQQPSGPPMPTLTSSHAAEPGLADLIREQGFVHLEAHQARRILELAGGLADWAAFAGSWNDLALDTYMADGGRYRRRRHAVLMVDGKGRVERAPHQPHYQGLEYNGLNGGIERWFEPVVPEVADGASLQAILKACHAAFQSLAPDAAAWKVELHQFRIEAGPGSDGKPTPEGMHRDGVDYVLVLLVRRENVASGTTMLAHSEKRPIGSFTLTEPLDSVLLDDRRVYHGVTPVMPIDPARPAYRDVLVVTFRKSA